MPVAIHKAESKAFLDKSLEIRGFHDLDVELFGLTRKVPQHNRERDRFPGRHDHLLFGLRRKGDLALEKSRR
jgi:hypothetical protein